MNQINEVDRLPAGLIRKLVKARVKENEARAGSRRRP
jgi:hypothetical protein